MISLEKLKILTPLQELPKNVGDLGKLIVAQAGHTGEEQPYRPHGKAELKQKHLTFSG